MKDFKKFCRKYEFSRLHGDFLARLNVDDGGFYRSLVNFHDFCDGFFIQSNLRSVMLFELFTALGRILIIDDFHAVFGDCQQVDETLKKHLLTRMRKRKNALKR